MHNNVFLTKQYLFISGLMVTCINGAEGVLKGNLCDVGPCKKYSFCYLLGSHIVLNKTHLVCPSWRPMVCDIYSAMYPSS